MYLITKNSLGLLIVRRAEAWTLPAGFIPMHWKIPASMPNKPLILKLFLRTEKKHEFLNNDRSHQMRIRNLFCKTEDFFSLDIHTH